tara:strand:+ start:1887 stop:2414 length:528 start_codon:yes stop_codon:yes gene_type:complete
MASGIEEPEYELLSEYEGFEIRRYSESVQARLLTPSSGWSGNSSGFRRIAGYIFGGNETNQRIAMTAPVQMWDTDSGSMMSFTMPSKYSIKDLPSPIDKGVEIVEVDEYVVAVLLFSGLSRNSKARRLMAKLETLVQASGLTAEGAPVLAVYDNPGTTLPFMRRNEIHLPLNWTD